MAVGILKGLKNVMEKARIRFGQRNKLACLPLADVVHTLENTLSSVEPRFLELGQSFQMIYDETNRFSTWVDQTIEMADGQVQGASIAGIGNYARDGVERLRKQQEQMLENLSVFEKVQDGLDTLSRHCGDAGKTVLLLKVIVLNIGIESNRDKASSEMFASFVKEVRDLAGHVETVIGSLLNDSERIRLDHETILTEIKGHVSRLTKLADKADTEMKESSRQIERMMVKTLESLNANRQSSEAMAKNLRDIVVALQMHDIVRQKAEEVVRDLQDAEQRIKKTRETGGFVRKGKMVRETGLAVLEQAGHMEAIIDVVEKTYHEVVLSFQGIQRHLAELYEGVSGRLRECDDLSSSNSPFSVLAASLKSLDSLVRESFDLGRTVEARIAEASEKVQTLSSYVTSVEHVSLDLRRKALNAIIKAAHLGDMGRGIEVFAQEVGCVSQDTNQFADNVIHVISKIRNMIVDLENGELTGGGVADGDMALDTGCDAIIDSFHRFNINAGKVAGQFEKIEAIIGRAESELVFFENFSSQLREHMERLRGMADELMEGFNPAEIPGPVLPAVLPPAPELSAECVDSSPPLLSEVHTRHQEPQSLPEDSENAHGETDNTLGDNVELF